MVLRPMDLRCSPDPSGERFRERRGVLWINEAGIPVVLELRCKNRECCQPLANHHAVHWFTLHGVWNGKPVGEYVTRQIPLREYGKPAPERPVPVQE